MKLKRIECKLLERAKNITVSESYVIGCTGQKAVILDKQLNHVYTVDKLDYVYNAQMSPDESKLLLISNGNKFYVVDMKSFEVRRQTVRAPYNENLEGIGCWSIDGKSILIPINKYSEGVNSTLRRYAVDEFREFKDYLSDKYCINWISSIKIINTYFMIGYNRKENNRQYFIYFDEEKFREIPLEKSLQLIMPNAHIDMIKEQITVTSIDGCFRFTLEGEIIEKISHPKPKDKKVSFSDVFMHSFAENREKQKELKDLSMELGLEDILARDYINKYKPSLCGKYMFLASESGFHVLDANGKEILFAILEKYGVQNFEELSPNIIAIATWHGVKLYELIE